MSLNADTPATVTIAVPSFNQALFLEKTLQSIFEQPLPVEVYVMDGGSTDGSLEIIQRWENRLSGWRSHEDNGQAAAINEGISAGTAPFVCWLNSDDFFTADGLQKMVDSLQANPDKHWLYAKCWTANEENRLVTPYLTLPFWRYLLANFCFVAQPATLMRRSAWETVGGVNPGYNLAFDFDLWWKLTTQFGSPLYLKEFVAASRNHENTKTNLNLDAHYAESIRVVKEHYGSVPLKWRYGKFLTRIFRKFLNQAHDA